MKLLSCALLCALALLFAPVPTAAATVTITVTGTITSGYDTSGVFFSTGLPMDLTNKHFALTHTYTDTVGTQSQNCSLLSGNTNCQSSITGTGTASPGTASLTIEGSTNTFIFGMAGVTASSDALIQVPSASSFSAGLDLSDNSNADNVSEAVYGNPGALLPFDWRTGFDGVLGYAGLSGGGYFNIGSGTNNANGNFTIASISESGFSCSASPSISIDTSATGRQPNILLPYDYTNIGVSFSAASTWFSGTLGYLNSGNYDQSPLLAFATDTSGKASIAYGSQGYNVTDVVTASACGGSNSKRVFDYKTYLGGSTLFNIHQSQLNNATFTNSTYLSGSQIQSFYENVVSGGCFLARFYLVNYGMGGVNSGFFDENNDGYYHYADDGAPYCSDGSTGCVPEGTTTASSLSAASAIEEVAIVYGVNPGLLVVKPEVEHSLNKKTTLPVYTVLNNAWGANTGNTFFAQLQTAADTYYTHWSNANASLAFPYFFPVINNHANQNIQFTPTLVYPSTCQDNTLVTGCYLVGYSLADASTYSQIKYTPFVQTSTSGGGVRLFEQLWYDYSQIWLLS